MAGREQERQGDVVGRPLALELLQERRPRLDLGQVHADGLAFLEHLGQWVVEVFASLPEPWRCGADLDAPAASPEIGFAVDFRMQRELEIGQATEGNPGGKQPLAGGHRPIRRCRQCDRPR